MYRNKLLFPIFAIIVGLSLGLFACEIFARIFYNPDEYKPSIPLGYKNYVALCYPTDTYNSFPLDLNNPQDLSSFLDKMPVFGVYDNILGKAFEKAPEMALESRISFLKREAPHCIIHDTSPSSLRRVIRPEKYNSSLALIGDSFAFGQGVRDTETYGFFLARELQAEIINFSNMGADLKRIFKQFKKALSEDKKCNFTRIIYLFVLNDPLMSPKLRKKQAYINDLMNYRPHNLRSKAGLFTRICF